MARNRPALEAERVQGTVKYFNDAKGYGFIVPDGTTRRQDECFVHYTAIQDRNGGRRSLADGARVEFEITEGTKGPQAENVVVI